MWAITRTFILLSAVASLSPAYRMSVAKDLADSSYARKSAKESDPTANATEAVEEKHPVHQFDWARVSGPQVLGCCVALFAFGILVSAAGIGGGGIYLAALMLIGGVSPRDAVPLSHAIVTLGALGSLMVNMRSWWSSGKVDIDVDACRMVVPASLLGSLFGFLLNTHISDKLILQLLAVVLSVLVGVVLRIWLRQRAEERAEAASAQQPLVQAQAGGEQPAGQTGATYQPPVVVMTVAGQPAVNEGKLPQKINKLEVMVSILLLLFVDVCSVLSFHMKACNVEKGQSQLFGSCNHPVLLTFLGRRLQFGTDPRLTDQVYFTVQWLPVLLCMCIAAFYAQRVYTQPDWSMSKVATVQSMGWATGVIAGLAGIGGGLIYSPFFLITMDPLMAVGTSSTCLLFIALSATLQFAFTDRLIMSLAVVYGLVVLVASVCGTSLVRLMRHRLPMGKSHITFTVVVAVILTNLLIVAKLYTSEHPHIYYAHPIAAA